MCKASGATQELALEKSDNAAEIRPETRPHVSNHVSRAVANGRLKSVARFKQRSVLRSFEISLCLGSEVRTNLHLPVVPAVEQALALTRQFPLISPVWTSRRL